MLTAEVIAVRKLTPKDIDKLNHLSGYGFIKNTFADEDFSRRSTRIPNYLYNGEATFGALDTDNTGSFAFGAEDLRMIIGAMAFGLAHLIAWNIKFPMSF
ncbi:hypothetical protein TruAng_005627 [Truncatella angustata]|nr:hypothetical protein TruAng_005627 [Truncatella angustata]